MVVIVPVSLWVENVCCNSRSPRPVEAIKLVRALERLKLTFVKFSQTARTVHPHHTRASPSCMRYSPYFLFSSAIIQHCRVPFRSTVAGGKVRLFHFLFEVLEDANMAHCVSWVPEAAAGVFRFSSTNKDQVAVLWGQRKGNKRPMTYQKMSRALRNYGRSGEIFKVKKKLTYQFSRETLTRLRKCERGDL
uniref:Transcription factor Spi-C n=1 Tax=Cyclopterus lumpus TaxID=8103 RepID=A0A8C2ZX83_CYCLU